MVTTRSGNAHDRFCSTCHCRHCVAWRWIRFFPVYRFSEIVVMFAAAYFLLISGWLEKLLDRGYQQGVYNCSRKTQVVDTFPLPRDARGSDEEIDSVHCSAVFETRARILPVHLEIL